MRLLVAFLAALSAVAQIPVWIDTDPSVAPGGKEVDDGIALLQAFHSKELRILGVSVVFGNADLPTAARIGRDIVSQFGPANLPFHIGAASAKMLGAETPASLALAAALQKQKMAILVLGPATNVATVLKNHPRLASRITQIIAVAGRRPGQHFLSGPKQKSPFRDLNFELDPAAFQVILDSNVPFTLAPWEISSKVWLTAADFEPQTPGMNWLRPAVLDWLTLWKEQFGADGFNPFDSLAVAVLVDRAALLCQPLAANLEQGPSDTPAQPGNKPYLLVRPAAVNARTVSYCHGVLPDFKSRLLRRLHSR